MLNQLLVRLLTWFHQEEGQDLVEYALITAVIAIPIITGLVLAGVPGAFQAWVDGVAAAING